MSRAFRVVLVALALAGEPLLISACSEGKAAVQPSPSPTQQRLLDMREFALLKTKATQVVLHVDAERCLRIGVLTEHELRSYVLERVASPGGSPVTAKAVPLVPRTDHATPFGNPYVFYSKAPLEPGYYQLELRGDGRVLSLMVDLGDWP